MPTKQRLVARKFRSVALWATGVLLLGGTPHSARAQNKSPEADVTKSAPMRFGYHFKTGETYHYKVTGLFDGHFPPFAAPGSDPIHIYIVLNYVAHVNKADAQGAEVAFHVDDANLLLLQEAIGPDGQLPSPEKQTDFPVPIGQIQSALDVKAALRPDGSVASVTGGDNNSQKINLGIDLRKLFLLMLPVTFPDNPVKPDDAWTFNDGLLGTNQGKTTYNARLLSLQSAKREILFRCSENAETQIDDRKDKSGKSVTKLVDAVDTTEGKATLKGEFSYSAPAQPDAKTNRNMARLQEGHFTLSAILTRKRTIPDPENPDAPLETHIDVTARLVVQMTNPAHKAAAPANATGLK